MITHKEIIQAKPKMLDCIRCKQSNPQERWFCTCKSPCPVSQADIEVTYKVLKWHDK